MTTLKTNQPNWKTMSIAGVQRIERVVAEFYVECAYLPSRYFRVKVTEDSEGHYAGRINVGLKSLQDDCPEWIVGVGANIDMALEDTIQGFLRSLDRCGRDKLSLTDEDFEWSACEDF
jgi:hypothetical protein